MGLSRYNLAIASVRCPSCGYVAELLSSDHQRSLWEQLQGFLNCNGCPECRTGELELTRTGFIDLRSPVRDLH